METLFIYQLLLLSVLFLYFLWTYGIKKNLLDSYRQNLFELRDKLFDFAVKGNVEFNDKAYRAVRKRLNLMIRFAHRLNTIDLLLSGYLVRKYPSIKNNNKEFLEAISDIKKLEVKNIITDILEEANKLSVIYFVKANIFSFWFAGIVIGIDAMIKGKKKSLKISRRKPHSNFTNSMKPLWVVSTIENRSIKKKITKPVPRGEQYNF